MKNDKNYSGVTDEEWARLQVISSRHNMDQTIRESANDNYWFRHAHDDRDYLLGVIDRLRSAQAHEPRAIVRHFARAMERKLAANDGVKGGWRAESHRDLLRHLRSEVAELEAAVRAYYRGLPVDDLLMEACDVALLAMMVSDNFGALPPTDERGR